MAWLHLACRAARPGARKVREAPGRAQRGWPAHPKEMIIHNPRRDRKQKSERAVKSVCSC
jgi:hypothetical protein